ncbi:MAG: DNA-binding Lrp family transcriptional regulator [Candidatus Nanohaloarchaea archaeon]|jgi:DNA-binding Lrp family transcriptional regulator
MDKVDEEIISILEDDGRASFTDIAERVDVSEGTVRNRVEKLQKNGMIEKFTVEVNRERGIEAFISVTVSTDREFSDIIDEFPDDLRVYELAGDMDILVKAERESSQKINEVVDLIRSVEGVESTQTYMILSEN